MAQYAAAVPDDIDTGPDTGLNGLGRLGAWLHPYAGNTLCNCFPNDLHRYGRGRDYGNAFYCFREVGNRCGARNALDFISSGIDRKYGLTVLQVAAQNFIAIFYPVPSSSDHGKGRGRKKRSYRSSELMHLLKNASDRLKGLLKIRRRVRGRNEHRLELRGSQVNAPFEHGSKISGIHRRIGP